MVDTDDEMVENMANNNPIRDPVFPINSPDSTDISPYVHDDITVEFLAQKTNFDELLYSVITSNAFEQYVQKYLEPLFSNDNGVEFKKLSRKVLKKKIIETYNDAKKDLKDVFEEFRGRLVVTCDVWSSFSGEDRYVSVMCHWIDENWIIEKRVIGFEMLYPCGHVDVARKVVEVLGEFDLTGKVGSVSFDDCVSKEKCMEHLVKEFDPIVLDVFFHDRTFANVVDLCGEAILDGLAPFIDPVWELVKWFRSSPGKIEEARILCKPLSGTPTELFYEFPKDWQSRFDYLQEIDREEEYLVKIYNACGDHPPLKPSQLDDFGSAVFMLDEFDRIAGRFSWPRDPNCHLVIHDCINIVHTLKSYESEPRFSSVAREVRRKWIELFPEIPTIYCVATILDPRVKVEGLRKLLAYYYESVGVDYNVDEKVAYCKEVLEKLHARYAPAAPAEESGSYCGFDVFETILKMKWGEDQTNRGDLAEYLFFNFEFSEDESDQWFELLKWWKKREDLFPNLSKVAKDILCIPISSSIPKSDSRPGKRVLDEKRSRLPADLIRVCICKKDWDLAEEYRRHVPDEDERSDSPDPEADEYM